MHLIIHIALRQTNNLDNPIRTGSNLIVLKVITWCSVCSYNLIMTAISEDEFCNSFYGAVQAEGSCGWYVRKSHKSLEKGLPYFAADTRILELGCNLGEHCAYVEHEYLTYVATDYREIDFEPLNSKIEFMVADAQNLPFPNDSFDRLIMTCVLHHLNFPEKALDEMRRVSRNGATISIIVPTDPGIMYRFAKKIGPYKKIVKKGAVFEPQYFHYQQHRNHFPGIVSFVRFIFRNDKISQKCWPFPWKFWNFNLFSVFQITVIKD
jgi:phosphatidylethanolamine/phosphatidyl-N-methylethanolamine N-methyltransferase